MISFNPFKWQGSGKVYSLPWLKNRLEYSADPKRIAEYAKTPFTRSGFVMKMLTQFHLSRNSIVVSEDSHAMWLKRISRSHMPSDDVIPRLAQDVIEKLFPDHVLEQEEQRFSISDRLVRELYKMLLENMLKVTILKPMEDCIMNTKFQHGSRPMALSGLMYSMRLHLPFLRPVRYVIDHLFFKEALYMKQVAKKLERMVCDFTVPQSGSWFTTLAELKESGKITDAQFRGEITSMFVSSFSLASAMGSALLCLAAKPRYQKKIHDDPSFARYFVMEVLRLYPPFRQFGYEQVKTTKDADLSASFASEFMVSVFQLHRNNEAWTDPKKFYPERFIEHDTTKGFKFLPFGMGKRNCPGRNFSMSLITQALKFICSDKSKITLTKREKLPRGSSGRLISFALDDQIGYRVK